MGTRLDQAAHKIREKPGIIKVGLFGQPSCLGKLPQTTQILSSDVAMSSFGKDQFKRNNVLTLVEALLKFTEGKVIIERQKLDALEKPVTLYSKEDKDFADCVWKPQKPLLLPGNSENKGITKEALWLLVECSGGTLQLPTPENPDEIDYKKQKNQVIQDIIDLLRDLNILDVQKQTTGKNKGKEYPTNQGYWKLELKLESCNSIDENLQYIRKQLKDKYGPAKIRKARTKIKSTAKNETPAMKLHRALLKLDYKEQSYCVNRTLDCSRIAAFLVHGEQETRPDLLFRRLIQENHGETEKPSHILIGRSRTTVFSIDSIFVKVANDIEKINNPKSNYLKYKGNRFNKEARVKIHKKIVRLWQNKDVIISFNKAEFLDKIQLQEIIDNFWQPLAKLASSEMDQNDNNLLFFIVDSKSQDFELSCLETITDTRIIESPIKLQKANPITKQELSRWIKNELCPTGMIEYRQELHQEICNMVNSIAEDCVFQEDIFQVICDILPNCYNITWEEQESLWRKY